MAYVITSACIEERAGECKTVCPVDCIAEGKSVDGEHMFFIDPDVCIECGACETACPVSAIYHENDVPESEKAYIEKNRLFYQQ